MYPQLFAEDLKAMTREFYSRFYYHTTSDAQVEHVLAGRG
jgi:iron complex transport system substrate-binding protein